MRSWFDSWVGKILWRSDRLPTPVFLGFPCGSAGKESPCNAGDLGSIPGLGRCPGEGKGYPLQYSGLDNSMESIVHGVQRVGHNWTTFIFTYTMERKRLLIHIWGISKNDTQWTFGCIDLELRGVTWLRDKNEFLHIHHLWKYGNE